MGFIHNIYVSCTLVLLGIIGCSSNPTPITSTNTTSENNAAQTETQTNNTDDATDQVDNDTSADDDAEDEAEDTEDVDDTVPFAVSSAAFADNGAIPLIYAANGQGGDNMSPPLQWGDVPAGTGSIAIQMTDLDSLQGGNPRVHWVITDIDATQTGLPANVPGGDNLAAPPEAVGANQTRDYGGPNPPNAHRYVWTIYAIKQGETLTGLTNNNSATNAAELEAKSLAMTMITGIFDPDAN